jgi:CheY-like chemotaxis protein
MGMRIERRDGGNSPDRAMLRLLSAAGGPGDSSWAGGPGVLPADRDGGPPPGAVQRGSAAGRVLVIDDNRALAENIAEILSLEDYDVEIAGSAEEGLTKALADDIRVIVTDYRLPGMNGAELVRRVRLSRQSVRALVISAYTDDSTARAAESAGATFLPKPLDFVLLYSFMRGAVGSV